MRALPRKGRNDKPFPNFFFLVSELMGSNYRERVSSAFGKRDRGRDAPLGERRNDFRPREYHARASKVRVKLPKSESTRVHAKFARFQAKGGQV